MRKNASAAEVTQTEICCIHRTLFESGDWTLLTDGLYVYLTEQRMGEYPIQKFEIPRAIFNRLIRRYERKQIVRP